ncbi:MAG: GHKL domain-containing protein, partial [Planctomycetes bacterium]|nr:GHKL domain-containing protein [Planctomycetota bacterium]
IRFEAKPVKDCIVFGLENNYRPGAYPKGTGVGLSSIRDLCGKNRGWTEVEDRDGVFKLDIILRLEGWSHESLTS